MILDYLLTLIYLIRQIEKATKIIWLPLLQFLIILTLFSMKKLLKLQNCNWSFTYQFIENWIFFDRFHVFFRTFFWSFVTFIHLTVIFAKYFSYFIHRDIIWSFIYHLFLLVLVHYLHLFFNTYNHLSLFFLNCLLCQLYTKIYFNRLRYYL